MPFIKKKELEDKLKRIKKNQKRIFRLSKILYKIYGKYLLNHKFLNSIMKNNDNPEIAIKANGRLEKMIEYCYRELARISGSLQNLTKYDNWLNLLDAYNYRKRKTEKG